MDVTSYMLGKKAGGGGGGSITPNIFVQTTEPETKEGIWVQTDKEYDTVVIDEDCYGQFEWSDVNKMEALPGSYNINGKSAFDSNELFLIDPNNSNLYKYVFQTRQWSTLKSSVSSLAPEIVTISEKYVVLYEGSTKNNIHIYNRINETWVTYNNLGSMAQKYSGAIVGDYIYYIGRSSNANVTVKINLTNGTKTTLSPLPSSTNAQYINCIHIGDGIIYLFLGNKQVYSYDTNTDTYTYITTTDVQLSNSNVNIEATQPYRLGNYVYFAPTTSNVSGTSKSQTKIYRFNLLNNTAEYMGNVQTNNQTKTYDYGNFIKFAIYDNTYILFGGQYYYKDGTYNFTDHSTKSLNLIPKSYTNKSLIIRQGRQNYSKNTQMYPNDFTGRLKSPIENVFIYDNNTLYSNLPTYIGDGTSWNKIKG